jgi:hypothetical protein
MIKYVKIYFRCLKACQVDYKALNFILQFPALLAKKMGIKTTEMKAILLIRKFKIRCRQI